MLKRISLALAGFALGALLTVPVVRAADTLFDDTQRQELHQIIRDYLINNPEVIEEALQALQARQDAQQMAALQQQVRDNAESLFHSEHDVVVGNPQGNITMVEFFDYNCGYCKRSLSDVLALMEADPELRLVLKEFPILGPGSMFAARAAIASRKQDKYWEFHRAMMEARGANDEQQVIRIAEEVGLDVDRLRADMESDEVELVIQQNYALAEQLGIQGTPAFLIEDRLIPGALGFEGLQTEIAEVRSEGTCVAC